MKLKYHVTFSILFSGIIHVIFKSWILTIVSLMSGIFIDIDHVVDYLFEFSFRFDIKDFFRVYDKRLNAKTYIYFHSWELLFFLLIASWFTHWNLWVTGVFLGFGQHLILDHFNEPFVKWLYFFVWRWKKGFINPFKSDL